MNKKEEWNKNGVDGDTESNGEEEREEEEEQGVDPVSSVPSTPGDTFSETLTLSSPLHGMVEAPPTTNAGGRMAIFARLLKLSK